MIRRPPRSTRTDTLFPYTTLFRSAQDRTVKGASNNWEPLETVAQQVSRGSMNPRTPAWHRACAGRIRWQRHPLPPLFVGDHHGRSEVPSYPIDPRYAPWPRFAQRQAIVDRRTEERRVGTEWVSTCSTGWSPYH